MSERFNVYGFSLKSMRELFRSGDDAAVRRITERLAAEHPHPSSETAVREASEVVRRAVIDGVPFPGLVAECYAHTLAASAMARDGQEWLVTPASVYEASALRDGLRRLSRKWAGPETRAFVNGLAQGVPLFGQQPAPDGGTYAAVGHDKLSHFLKGLRDLATQIEWRAARKGEPVGEEADAARFAAEFCGCVEQVVDAGKDLWLTYG
jgi:hypothetical protein